MDFLGVHRTSGVRIDYLWGGDVSDYQLFAVGVNPESGVGRILNVI